MRDGDTMVASSAFATGLMAVKKGWASRLIARSLRHPLDLYGHPGRAVVNQRGFSLVELLISMLSSSLVVLAVVGVRPNTELLEPCKHPSHNH